MVLNFFHASVGLRKNLLIRFIVFLSFLVKTIGAIRYNLSMPLK